MLLLLFYVLWWCFRQVSMCSCQKSLVNLYAVVVLVLIRELLKSTFQAIKLIKLCYISVMFRFVCLTITHLHGRRFYNAWTVFISLSLGPVISGPMRCLIAVVTCLPVLYAILDVSFFSYWPRLKFTLYSPHPRYTVFTCFLYNW